MGSHRRRSPSLRNVLTAVTGLTVALALALAGMLVYLTTQMHARDEPRPSRGA
jgi:hypothetical protein